VGSGGGGSETSSAEGDTKGSPCEVFVGGGDFKELALLLTLVPLDDLKSPLVLMCLELFRLKRPISVSWTSLSEDGDNGGVPIPNSHKMLWLTRRKKDSCRTQVE
jgi:hypothetical protein